MICITSPPRTSRITVFHPTKPASLATRRTRYLKLSGLKHIYMQYIAGPHKLIHISSPYNNRECLHCHSGMRVFDESPVHAAMMDELKSNSISCLSSGCHDVVHNTSGLAK